MIEIILVGALASRLLINNNKINDTLLSLLLRHNGMWMSAQWLANRKILLIYSTFSLSSSTIAVCVPAQWHINWYFWLHSHIDDSFHTHISGHRYNNTADIHMMRSKSTLETYAGRWTEWEWKIALHLWQCIYIIIIIIIISLITIMKIYESMWSWWAIIIKILIYNTILLLLNMMITRKAELKDVLHCN